MKTENIKQVYVKIAPGACGFECILKAEKLDKRNVCLKILSSDCEQIQRLSESIHKISIHELFAPLTRNIVYIFAEKAGCHGSCPVPTGLLKAAEVAMDMAVPRDVEISFE